MEYFETFHATAIFLTDMAPITRRSNRKGASIDPELMSLLASDPPHEPMLTRHGQKAQRQTDAHPRRLDTPAQSRVTLRVRIRNGSHGTRVSFVSGPTNPDRKKYHTKREQKQKNPAQEAVRLDWMRRLRPRPHRSA
jgi:hypothetical protein